MERCFRKVVHRKALLLARFGKHPQMAKIPENVAVAWGASVPYRAEAIYVRDASSDRALGLRALFSSSSRNRWIAALIASRLCRGTLGPRLNSR
jgi:hypothetical protein